jgi:hypothetical protein
LVTQLKTLTQLCFQPACHPVNPNAPPEELWEPEGASYYNGELILQPRQRWTLEQQLELLDTHPLFTGRYPRCEMTYPKYETPPVHWDCSACGWMIRCEAMVRRGFSGLKFIQELVPDNKYFVWRTKNNWK